MSSGKAELYAACLAAQQAMGTENMARELTVHLDALELQVDANAATGFIGRQGLGKLKTSGRELLVAAISCAREASQPEESSQRATWQISGRMCSRRTKSIDT